jgi:hypothetical protein
MTKNQIPREEEEEESGRTGESGEAGESGSSGSTGSQVEFRDFMGANVPSRDDLLSPAEKRSKLIAHQSDHDGKVRKQKATREERRSLKEGKISLEKYYQGLQAQQGQYNPNHPIASKAQFSGQSRQVSVLPTEQVAETNDKKRQELDYSHRLRYQHEAKPRFEPPKLTRR